jgi:hypothetical protein
VHETTSTEILGQRRSEMLREAELNRPRKALQANRRVPATPRLASTIAWELIGAAALLREFFEASRDAT